MSFLNTRPDGATFYRRYKFAKSEVVAPKALLDQALATTGRIDVLVFNPQVGDYDHTVSVRLNPAAIGKSWTNPHDGIVYQFCGLIDERNAAAPVATKAQVAAPIDPKDQALAELKAQVAALLNPQPVVVVDPRDAEIEALKAQVAALVAAQAQPQATMAIVTANPQAPAPAPSKGRPSYKTVPSWEALKVRLAHEALSMTCNCCGTKASSLTAAKVMSRKVNYPINVCGSCSTFTAAKVEDGIAKRLVK